MTNIIRINLRVLILILTFLFSTPTVFACMYGPPYRTVCETYTQASSVIIGKIEEVNEKSPSRQIVSIKIKRTYKGKPLKRITLDQPLSTCDWDFREEKGKTLLLYLSRDKKTNKYSAIAEGMGGEIKKQSDDLYWLNGLPQSLKRTRLSGDIQLYNNEPFSFIDFVAGAKVRVFDEKNSFEATTDKNGVYQLWDVPIGRYQIKPTLPSDLKQGIEIEKGLVDFDTLKQKGNEDDVLIEIQAQSCGGIDFVVNKKNN